MAEKTSFICPVCGEEHEGLPTNWAYNQPDEIFALSYLEKYRRVRVNSDLCTLDESRYFIRGFLPIPLHERGSADEEFTWGIWAEVSRRDHDNYVQNFHQDGSREAPFSGRIANAITGYDGTLGEPVEIRLGKKGDRPGFWLPAKSRHRLAQEQSQGITSERQHELLKLCGFFDKK